MPHRIEISYRSILFTVFFLLFLWILYQVRDVIYLLIFSFVVMSGLRPLVDRLEELKIPRPFAILLVYIALFTLVGLAMYLIIPPLISQLQLLFIQLEGYIQLVLPFIDLTPENITQQLPFLSQNVLKFTTSIFSMFFGLFTFFVFTFYFLLERRHLKHFLVNFVGREAEEKITLIVRKVESRLGAWVLGQVTLGIIIGIATYIGLSLLRLEFALSLAIIAGLLEIVPIIGPIISAIPAVLVAIRIDPIMAIWVVALYTLIQQLENNVLVPVIMRRAVGLPPLVTIIALMIGGKIAGIGGIILAVPLVVASQVIIRELLLQNEKKATNQISS